MTVKNYATRSISLAAVFPLSLSFSRRLLLSFSRLAHLRRSGMLSEEDALSAQLANDDDVAGSRGPRQQWGSSLCVGRGG